MIDTRRDPASMNKQVLIPHGSESGFAISYYNPAREEFIIRPLSFPNRRIEVHRGGSIRASPFNAGCRNGAIRAAV